MVFRTVPKAVDSFLTLSFAGKHRYLEGTKDSKRSAPLLEVMKGLFVKASGTISGY